MEIVCFGSVNCFILRYIVCYKLFSYSKCIASYTVAVLRVRKKLHLQSVVCSCLMEVNFKTIIVYAMKAYRGSTRTVPLIPCPGTRCR